MKILQITPEAPGKYSGGQLGIIQTLLSLIENGCEVDYVGPHISDSEISALYSHTYILEPSNNTLLRIYDTFHHNTNQRYRSWLKLDLDFESYDRIILEFTKLDYVLERVPKERVIVRVHNVEADYSEKNYRYHKTVVNYLDKVFSRIREKKIVQSVPKLLVLTENDKKRLRKLYQVSDKNIQIVPVCAEDHGKTVNRQQENQAVNMILTGSLWFGPNYEGIKWFLENVYQKLDFPKSLIIAGARPNKELVDMVKGKEDIRLIDSPKSMEPLFGQSDLAITPIFDGAGMKVKVAEALSYGLPVVGTSHAFIGYEMEHGINGYCGNSPEEFIQSIYNFYQLKQNERQKIKNNSYQLFQKYYSQERSRELFGQVLNELSKINQ